MPTRHQPAAHRAQLLAVRARDMRNAMSEEEQILWREIRQRKLGVAFRRQVPLLGFIVDLLAQEQRLIVEIDGLYHRRRRRADTRRDEKLQRAGWRVLRIEGELVRRDLLEALRRIREALHGGEPP
jgi:very-short-patch-repair endonuclease